jgi:hypothetical protein
VTPTTIDQGATFGGWRAFETRSTYNERVTMRNAVPLFLALIPFIAVVGACVAVP